MTRFSNDLIISGYLECAKNDRKACEILYSSKQFPLAVYHLQQYIEKLSKAFALEFEKCLVSEVVNSHDILEILEKGQRRLGLLKNDEEFQLKKWANGIDTVSSITEDDIEMMLDDLNVTFKASLPNYIKDITFEQLNMTARYYATITALCIFTRQHGISTRYPAVYHDMIDYSSYTIDSGLVRSFTPLFAHAVEIERFLTERTECNGERIA
jgi:HEPN domain-containing protein